MGKSPESEIQAKLFADIGEKCGENLAKMLQIFVLRFPGKMGARNFTKNPRNFSRATKKERGPQLMVYQGSVNRGLQTVVEIPDAAEVKMRLRRG